MDAPTNTAPEAAQADLRQAAIAEAAQAAGHLSLARALAAGRLEEAKVALEQALRAEREALQRLANLTQAEGSP